MLLTAAACQSQNKIDQPNKTTSRIPSPPENSRSTTFLPSHIHYRSKVWAYDDLYGVVLKVELSTFTPLSSILLKILLHQEAIEKVKMVY